MLDGFVVVRKETDFRRSLRNSAGTNEIRKTLYLAPTDAEYLRVKTAELG